MRTTNLTALILGLLVVPAIAAPSSPAPTPPSNTIQFGYNPGGSNNGFTSPYVDASTQGVPIIAGSTMHIEFALGRFLFNDCGDAATISTATVILKTHPGGGAEVDQEINMQVVPGYGALATFQVPAEPSLQIGFVASTPSGCQARDTNLESYYQFPVDTGWKSPAVISFDSSSAVPTPSAPLTTGDWLVVQYDPARANVAGFGTDSKGDPIALSSVRYQTDGANQLDIASKVQFLDGNGNPVGGVQTQTVVQTPSMGPASQPGYYKVPDGAKSVSVYFEAETYSYQTNRSVPGGWDSNGGSNFTFPVQSPTPGLAGSLTSATSGP